MNKRLILFILFLPWNIWAQEEMDVQTAIRLALENNYRIKLVENTAQQSENRATKGQAGLLPTVSANAAADYGNDNTRLQLLNSPDEIRTNGAESFLVTASVDANYTLYAGGQGNYTYDKLLLMADVSDAQSRLQMEAIIMQVVSAYYNIQRAEQNLNALSQTIEISSERYKRAENRQKLSGGSKVEVLNSNVDLQQDTVNYIAAQQAYEEALITFNQLLGRDLNTPLALAKSDLDYQITSFDELKNKAFEQNSEIQNLRLSEQISMLDYKIAKSAYLPKLSLGASYSYSRQESEGSFLRLNETNGLGARLTLSIPIYSGGTRKIAVQNAGLQQEQVALQISDRESQLEMELLKAFKDYERAKKIVDLERKNLQLNEENFSYTDNQFKLGLANSTVYRQAQLNLLLIRNNLNNLEFNLRLAELEIMRLTGDLIRKE